MKRRTVVSISVSERNRDAVIVMEELRRLDIPLTYSGGQLLAWAAAYLTAPNAERRTPNAEQEEIFGMAVDELDARLDDW